MPRNSASSGQHMIALGLNPAWQRTLTFSNFIPGDVNRASALSCFPAGKGINFARAARNWGADTEVYHFLGGDTGKKIDKSLGSEKIRHSAVWLESPTRTCTTCLSCNDGSMTELIEPSDDVPVKAVESLGRLIKSKLDSCAGIAFCGTYPGGVGADFYAGLASLGRRRGIKTLLDCYKGIGKTLQAGVTILKVNRFELGELAREGKVADAAGKLFEKYDIEMIAVTDGPGRAYLFTRHAAYEYSLPDLGKIVNPIGAGDTVSAVLLDEYLADTAPEEAFRLALGAGSASCLRLKAADFSRREAIRISSMISCRKR